MKSESSLARFMPEFLGIEAQRFLFGFLLVLGKLERAHLGGARRVVLAQRMAFPGLRHQNAAQARVAVEADAEHVPGFALVPGRRRATGR